MLCFLYLSVVHSYLLSYVPKTAVFTLEASPVLGLVKVALSPAIIGALVCECPRKQLRTLPKAPPEALGAARGLVQCW